MDIYCPICGEPWSMYSLRDAPVFFEEARRRFAEIGCALFNTSHSSPPNNARAAKARVLFQLVGEEDMDAIAGLLDDLMS